MTSTMNTKILALALLASGSALLSSCTTTTTTTAQTGQRPDVEITSEKRSYSQRELMKRGGPGTAESLQAQDASVYISGRGR